MVRRLKDLKSFSGSSKTVLRVFDHKCLHVELRMTMETDQWNVKVSAGTNICKSEAVTVDSFFKTIYEHFPGIRRSV